MNDRRSWLNLRLAAGVVMAAGAIALRPLPAVAAEAPAASSSTVAGAAGPDGGRQGGSDAAPSPAYAAQGGVTTPEAEPEERRIALSYNPFTLHLLRIGLNIEVLLASHHVIIATPFYATTTTNDDSNRNVFRGFGAELGYRHYSGQNGPRGFYVGPSFLFAKYDAIPQLGDTIGYTNLGAAIDAGYQSIVAHRWVVGIGGGLQYTVPSVTFPQQELTASIFANRGLRPRLLLALGVAFDP